MLILNGLNHPIIVTLFQYKLASGAGFFVFMYSNSTPDRNRPVPEITNATTNAAANLNAQIQAILDRLQYNYNLTIQIAEQQVLLQQQFNNTGVSTIAPLLTEIQQLTEALNQQNISLTDRFISILQNLTTAETAVTSLTAAANTIETKGATRRIDVNYQRSDPDLVAIAALVATANRVIQSSASNVIALVPPPNFGALPPSIYRSAWSPPSGTHSGFTAGQAGIWIPLSMAQVSAGPGYSHSGNRAIVPAGHYDIHAEVEGVGCVEFNGQLVQFVAGVGTPIAKSNTGFTVQSGGSLGASFAIKAYIKTTVNLPACELELQFKFKSPHTTAALSGGMAVSTPDYPEEFAKLRLTRIA